jgi:cyclopropane fatty-acyl-phospholipid synthase-like methyltransferase
MKPLEQKYLETFQTWNKLAGPYEEKFMNLTIYNESYDLLCELLTKQQIQVLEVGCGPGNITRYLLSKRPDFNVLATDVAPEMIQSTKRNNPLAECAVLDLRDLHLLKPSYDAIVAGFCLPYLSPRDLSDFFKNAFFLLNPQGLIYLSFVEGAPEQSGYQTGRSGDRVFFYYHTLETISSHLIQNGFQVLKTLNVHFQKVDQSVEMHTILIAGKPSEEINNL